MTVGPDPAEGGADRVGDAAGWLDDGDPVGDSDAGGSDPADGDSDPAGGSLPIGGSDPVGSSPPWAGAAAAAAETPSPPADTVNDRTARLTTRTPAMSDRLARTPDGTVQRISSPPPIA